MWRAFLAVGMVIGSTALLAETPALWDWAFFNTAPIIATGTVPLSLPGSRQTYTEVEMRDPRLGVDWFPDRHPAMPAAVAKGHGAIFACGYCHQPDGNGRPENSALSGLSPAYIAEQVRYFADGSRKPAVPTHKPSLNMATTARGLNDEEIEAAARYFGALPFVSHVRVVEAARIPRMTQEAFIYRRQGDRTVELGARIVETPVDFKRFEMRDPDMQYIAYVPPGSIAAGRGLARRKGPIGQSCAGCHGAGLRGGIAPPLAGRSPTMIFRQLAAFKTGSRANPEAAPMRSIVAELDTRQMIALSAYAASLKP